MIRGLRHTGIVVCSLDESLRFYHDLLGFEVTKRLEESGDYIDRLLDRSGAGITTVKMEAPDGHCLELLDFHAIDPHPTTVGADSIGITHIALTVDDLGEEHARLTREGVSFLSSPQQSPDRYAKVAFCRAPEGTLVELVEVRH